MPFAPPRPLPCEEASFTPRPTMPRPPSAFERGDLPAMMAVWAESDSVVCIHPRGPRLVGFDAVRESWMQIFAGGGTRLRIASTEVRRFEGPNVSVRALVEVISAPGQAGAQPVCATNVYELTPDGWRMVLHHATPMPEPARAAQEEEPASGPHTLH